MPGQRLDVEVPRWTPTIGTALHYLRRYSRIPVRVYRVRDAAEPPGAGRLRIEPGSTFRSALTFQWGEAPSHVDPRSVTLALSQLAWTGSDGFEPWRAIAAPLHQFHRLGRPDFERRWVLVEGGELDLAEIEGLTGLTNPQIHRLGIRGRRRVGGVSWLVSPRVIPALLGRVEAVVAPAGPLAWDAQRANVPCIDPNLAGTEAPDDSILQHRLSFLAPPALLESPAFWRALAQDIASGMGLENGGTVRWISEAAADPYAHRRDSALRRIHRKLLKLRRDPQAFFNDSRMPLLRSAARSFSDPGTPRQPTSCAPQPALPSSTLDRP